MKNKILKLISIASVLSMGIISTSHAAVWLAVVPADNWDTESPNNNTIPFSYYECGDRVRYQQVIPGSVIGQGTVGSIAFRLNGSIASDIGPITYENATVKLSSTLVTAYTISDTFSDNVGPDETTVFSGDMVLSATVSASDPNPFDINIPINAAFEFDGTKANLLLDITMDYCHAQSFSLDSIGSSESVFGRAYGHAEDASGGSDSAGLVTQITMSTPPPTPNTAGLSGNWSIDGHTGEGFLIDVLDNGLLVVFWFTYDPSGNPVWLLGTTNSMLFDEADLTLSILGGATFGPGFDPNDVVSTPWGTMHIEFDNCGQGTVGYSSSIGYGSGNYNISKVYGNEQNSCP